MLDRRRVRARRTSRVRRRHLRLVAIGLAATLTLLGFGSKATATVVASEAMPYFGDGANVVVAPPGTAPTKQHVVTAAGGDVEVVPSFAGSGDAADFPAYDGSVSGPRAVVAMVNTTSADVMTPGSKEFAFGADINGDAVSAGTQFDNGNNFFQRGLFGDKSQYKLQIDHGYAMCRVKGTQSAIALTSKFLMPTEQWHRVRCLRKVLSTGDQLWLEIAPINPDGTLGVTVRNKSGIKKLGWLNFPIGTPVSIGGKLISATQLHGEPDQFNGLIDNPVLDIN